MEGLNFPEAVKRVAELSGVMLPSRSMMSTYEGQKKKREEKKQLADRIIELNQVALEFWEAELKKKNSAAKAVQRISCGPRHLGRDTNAIPHRLFARQMGWSAQGASRLQPTRN